MTQKTFDPLKISQRYPKIPLIAIHYYGLKGYGINYDTSQEGRPKFHIRDEDFLFSVVPMMSEQDSPYVYADKLTFNGDELPFKVQFIKWIKGIPSYFYYRNPKEWIQTIDSKIVLTTNFQQSCTGCSFCCRDLQDKLKNITSYEGMNLVINAGANFSEMDEVAIVTGMFRDEKKVIKHIAEISEIATAHGFKGHLFYIGSQIQTKEGVKSFLDAVNGMPIRYAYTVESFTKKDELHPIKNLTLEETLRNLNTIRDGGIERLEYTYMPGIDSFSSFNKTALKFANLAKPHVSIFRPANQEQRGLMSEDFIQNPVDYLCMMRLQLEELYGGPIYGNNLGNLWLFPTNRVNPIFLTDRTSAN